MTLERGSDSRCLKISRIKGTHKVVLTQSLSLSLTAFQFYGTVMYLHRNKAALTAHAMLGNVERYNSERKSRGEKERIIVRYGLRDP